MAKNKTTETENSVNGFIDRIADETKKADSWRIIGLMKAATGYEPKMWGTSIIGFGTAHYKYESGHEGDMPLVCFSPRKAAIVLYLCNFPERDEMLSRFGKYKQGKGCIYFKKLPDINEDVLKQMIAASVKYMNALKQPC